MGARFFKVRDVARWQLGVFGSSIEHTCDRRCRQSCDLKGNGLVIVALGEKRPERLGGRASQFEIIYLSRHGPLARTLLRHADVATLPAALSRAVWKNRIRRVEYRARTASPAFEVRCVFCNAAKIHAVRSKR